jgi:hypothetical protein
MIATAISYRVQTKRKGQQLRKEKLFTTELLYNSSIIQWALDQM